jgi:hypothetical protein
MIQYATSNNVLDQMLQTKRTPQRDPPQKTELLRSAQIAMGNAGRTSFFFTAESE